MGRRHAHAVWSRIDPVGMKAINLPHYKLKLQDAAREIYLEQGWDMPRGFVNKKERDRTNFTQDQWQQAKRAEQDPQAIKRLFQECWSSSDSDKAFAQALKARGYALARGDRRGYVAVDYRGEVYSVSRYVDVRTKQVRQRLGDPSKLPSIEEAKTEMAAGMTNMLKLQVQRAEQAYKTRSVALRFERTQLLQRQREERERLRTAQEQRWNAETRARAERLSSGFRGIWDRLTGKYAGIKRQNERDALLAFYRDREEKDKVIFSHIEERQRLHGRMREERKTLALEVQRLHREIATRQDQRTADPSKLREQFRKAVQNRQPGRDRNRGPNREI